MHLNRITAATIVRIDLERENRKTCEEAITVMQKKDDMAWARMTEMEFMKNGQFLDLF